MSTCHPCADHSVRYIENHAASVVGTRRRTEYVNIKGQYLFCIKRIPDGYLLLVVRNRSNEYQLGAEVRHL
jgi:hypothetical protein